MAVHDSFFRKVRKFRVQLKKKKKQRRPEKRRKAEREKERKITKSKDIYE